MGMPAPAGGPSRSIAPGETMKIGIPLTAALLLYWLAIGLLGAYVRFDQVPFLSAVVVVVSVSVFVGTYAGFSRLLNGPHRGEHPEQ